MVIQIHYCSIPLVETFQFFACEKNSAPDMIPTKILNRHVKRMMPLLYIYFGNVKQRNNIQQIVSEILNKQLQVSLGLNHWTLRLPLLWKRKDHFWLRFCWITGSKTTHSFLKSRLQQWLSSVVMRRSVSSVLLCDYCFSPVWKVAKVVFIMFLQFSDMGVTCTT